MNWRRVDMRILSVFLILCFSCSERVKEKLIYGKIIHADNQWIYLQQVTEQGERTIDSALAGRDGSFEMRNPVTETDFYVLRANPTNLIFLLLHGNENVEITGDARQLESTYKVRGSKDSELIQQLRHYDSQLSDSLNKLYETQRALHPEKSDSIGGQLQKEYINSMQAYARDFILRNKNSLIALSATQFLNQQNEIPLMKELGDSLQLRYPDNRYVSDYLLMLADLQKLPIGSEAPEIQLSSPDGKEISLSSFRGKIVLIDFWASWCQPCRRENPMLVELYGKYRNMPFEILGVSLDENKSSWTNAIRQDGLTWPQVSDLKRWQSVVVNNYQIESIPYSVLVDRDGRIIAKGLRGHDIESKIQEALAGNL
jgi:thiol-disulfide isomerase/thioredoxin